MNLFEQLSFYDFDEHVCHHGSILLLEQARYPLTTYSDLMYSGIQADYVICRDEVSRMIQKIVAVLQEDCCYLVRYSAKWFVREEELPATDSEVIAEAIKLNPRTVKIRTNSQEMNYFLNELFEYNSFFDIAFVKSQVVVSPTDHLDIFVAQKDNLLADTILLRGQKNWQITVKT